MRCVWLNTLVAALCVSASPWQLAAASPFGPRMGSESMAASTSDESWTDTLKFWKKDEPAQPTWTTTASRPTAPKPTDEISPWRNPIQYFSAAMKETPVAETIRRDKSTVAAKPKDSISLDTPVGPATPQYYIAMSQAAERQGKIVVARQQIQQGMAKFPKDIELIRAAARMEDRQGKLPLAETLYRRAAAINPQHAGALNDLGLCLARQGEMEQSVQTLEQAINLQPDKALYRNNAATVLVEMRQDQRALAHLSAVHGPAASNYNLGKLLVDRGRPHEAFAYFQTAVEIDPTLEPAHMAIAQLQGATPQVASTHGMVMQEAATAMPQQIVAPTVGPQLAPPQAASEPSFPATARGPAFGTSSYVPPSGYYPSTALPTAPAAAAPMYQTATAPRYLPPVPATAPSTTPARQMAR